MWKWQFFRRTTPSQHWCYKFLFFLLVLAIFVFPLIIASEEEDEEITKSEVEKGATTDVHEEESGHHEEGEEGHEVEHAVLFPSFSLTIGVLVFFMLSRYAHALPYTGVMFLIGILMGIGVVVNDNADDVLNTTILQWVNINSHVLLLVFLPGLIFKDSYGQEVHIFFIALSQCIIFAFPMVLAGTTLTALIAYYIFPYGWSFNLAMTFGSILSATDPVAVAALLEQVGAPPRLKVHIAGEALLNDGAAIVFFDIFVKRYLVELDIPGVGEEIDWGDGIVLFLRKALGAVAIGLFFGIGLLVILYVLDWKFNREEDVVEVSATVAVAYLGYYVAEIVWETSGVLATVVLGVLVKFLGRPMINDPDLLNDFWTLVEHLLNTILFTLGGAVWGAVVTKGELDRSFNAKDWGYLIMLYVLLHVIRLFLFVVAYPVTSRIGLKTNWPETIFQVYGGLRGAVGIALAISLDNEVREASGGASTEYTEQTRKAFGYIGGVAFMTLCINGVTAGPLLRKLGLADSTETREKIVKAYHTRFQAAALDELVRLLTRPVFRNVNFALVKHHVPYLADITRSQLMEAVEKHKDTTRPEHYSPPYLERILPYLEKEKDIPVEIGSIIGNEENVDDHSNEFDPEMHARKMKRILRTKNRMKRRSKSTMRVMMGAGVDPLSLIELRSLFISVLRAAYDEQMRCGELSDRHFLSVALNASLDFAEDAISRGEKLCDWEYVMMLDSTVQRAGKSLGLWSWFFGCIQGFRGKKAKKNATVFSIDNIRIERSLAVMAAHRWAQQFLHEQFQDTECSLSETGKLVFNESQEQYKKAQAVLETFPPEQVENVVSHKFCLILLNNGVSYISKLEKNGLLKEQEAEHKVHEILEHMESVITCSEREHPGEIARKEERQSYMDLMAIKEEGDG